MAGAVFCICRTFSSSVIRETMSAARRSGGRSGFRYGGMFAACPAKWMAAAHRQGIASARIICDLLMGWQLLLVWLNLNYTLFSGALGVHASAGRADARVRRYAAGVTSISPAMLVGSGAISPNSRRVSRWPEIASRMFRSVSSKVRPVVTQPGRSGTYAAQFVSARSKMTAYFRFILSPPDPLPSGWISEYLWAKPNG